MAEVRIAVSDIFKKDISSALQEGSSCSEAEPFALQVTDNSMEPEFDQGCIIIIDRSGIVRDGAFVFAKDSHDEYIFRRLRIRDGRHYLEALNPSYASFEIQPQQVEGVITQRAGKRRSYHKWYD
ncbi:S24 family peptidase [Thiolinea disciformis]|uniref:S24 family peptidase n=1 Tax=Thiolinea disciformis TaxID=125614 RepID=UPI00037F51E4|nr:S24 family peptidase [Thiolinea disciformis]